RLSGIILSSSSSPSELVSFSLPHSPLSQDQRRSATGEASVQTHSPSSSPPNVSARASTSRGSIIFSSETSDQIISFDLETGSSSFAETPVTPAPAYEDVVRDPPPVLSESPAPVSAPAPAPVPAAARPPRPLAIISPPLHSSFLSESPSPSIQPRDAIDLPPAPLGGLGFAQERVERGPRASEDFEGLKTDPAIHFRRICPASPQISDLLLQPDQATSIQAITSAWPVSKFGFILRKDIPAAEVALAATRPRVDRERESGQGMKQLIGRSFGSLLKGGRRKSKRAQEANAAAASAASTSSADAEEEWNLYYAEVRGRYLMFYVVMEPERRLGVFGSGSGSSSPPVSMLSGRSSPSSYGGRAAMRSGSSENIFQKPLAKCILDRRLRRETVLMVNPPSQFFNLGSKSSSRSGYGKKPSTEFSRTQIWSSGDRPSSQKSRPSNESHRSAIAQFGSLADVKSAPRLLVHYLPLESVTIDVATISSSSSSTSSFASALKVPAPGTPLPPASTVVPFIKGSSNLILTLRARGADQVVLDVVPFDELMWDASSSNELTVSSSASFSRDTVIRRSEIVEWYVALRHAVDRGVGALVMSPGRGGLLRVLLGVRREVLCLCPAGESGLKRRR
ncbi:hypothetical protein BDK51DRAFT_49509, partial [Blyttiomyces helicus]